ncbi:MAG: DUF4855 domain-containing protein [Verrucomicrobiota bacterium]|nr:DUF4855 domain-containing protein [Verrucomicrobiota bacterium]
MTVAVFATAFLRLQTTPAVAADGFFPLWQKKPPNAADTVLIYQGGSGRLPWTPAQLAPYVSYRDPRDGREKWLFDGFLFIEYHDQNRTFSEGEGGGNWTPADKQIWRRLLDKNFEPGHGVAALEQCCAETQKRLGPPLRPRQVILTLPEPIVNFTNWGELNGHKLDFSVLADRVAACQWYIGQALEKWRMLAPKHLELAGFYFVPEHASPPNRQLLPLLSRILHEHGLCFFWIPYWRAAGAGDWRALGFDLASQQPNYFFHPGLPSSRLQEACDFARGHGMGLEMEFDDRVISQPRTFAPRFDAYLKAFADNGVKASVSMSYYEGGGTILRLARSKDKALHGYYDRIAQWVLDRQRSADEQFRRANSKQSP